MIKLSVLSVLAMGSIVAQALVPAAPVMPQPSAAQAQMTMPADLFSALPVAGADSVYDPPLAEAWILPVERNISPEQAETLLKNLQAQAYNAFMITEATGSSVYIGPEASKARLLGIANLLKQQLLPVASPIAFNPLSETMS